MTRKDLAPVGAEVQPTGVGGSYVIDPATGLPMAAASTVSAAPDTPPAEPAKKKDTGK